MVVCSDDPKSIPHYLLPSFHHKITGRDTRIPPNPMASSCSQPDRDGRITDQCRFGHSSAREITGIFRSDDVRSQLNFCDVLPNNQSRPPLLVPAMHVHLLNCKSADPLSRRLGLNKLELCMIVLEQMQHTHPSSSVFRGIFLEAIRHIFPSYVAQSNIPELAISESSPPQDVSTDDPLAGITIGEDAIDALMDEVSIFNFWESLNSMQT
jgi:hypothetical protein